EADQGIAGALVADGVRLRDNGGDGMWVVAAGSVAFHDAPGVATEVTGNGVAGFAVGFGGSAVSLVGGSFSNNLGDNIRVGAVNGQFTAKNLTANGGGRGLYLGTASAATLSGVTLDNNAGAGLELFSSAPPVNATAVVQNSSFQGNSIGAKIDGGLTTSVAISNSQFNNNTKLNANSGGQTGVGLAVHGGIVSVDTSQFQQNTVGAQLTEADGSLKITTSIVSGNTSFGVKSLSTTPVDAVFNYWGSGTGPTHASNASGIGDKVSNYVEFAPWASSNSFTAAAAPKVVGGNLVIGGTSSIDTITVSESSTNYIVTLNGQSSTFLKSTVTDHIVVYAFAGGDTVQVTAAKAAEIHGGAGNDTLTGGTAKDVIWGDDGADTLWSGGGDDVLIGGAGQDELHGAGGKDILLGGDFKTGLRHNDVEAYRYAALKSISSQWVGGLQDSDLTSLADDVVDTEKDSIWGGAAADWILGNLWSGSSPYDLLNDYNAATDKRTSF
ncbi:MAG TPA: right-handed parallel beta-helix repeat-containing protein, partial [Pirellulaceae bacterium]|nr:right-handed parallel beta-helix repeat-containing protein [Pirellulaceae bacterium]